MQAKNKFLRSIFRFVSYTAFLLILLLTDNIFNYSDSKILAIFMLFSLSFEFVILEMKNSCRKVWASVLCILILSTGAFLIEKTGKYDHGNKILIKMSDLTEQK